jgi:hypothetical protein
VIVSAVKCQRWSKHERWRDRGFQLLSFLHNVPGLYVEDVRELISRKLRPKLFSGSAVSIARLRRNLARR